MWKQHGLKPHRIETFKLSNDPRFEEKLVDVVGLYLDPPEHAIVLSVDEKSQIPALDRTQPGLPMLPGRCGTMTHDYKRNGTTPPKSFAPELRSMLQVFRATYTSNWNEPFAFGMRRDNKRA